MGRPAMGGLFYAQWFKWIKDSIPISCLNNMAGRIIIWFGFLFALFPLFA